MGRTLFSGSFWLGSRSLFGGPSPRRHFRPGQRQHFLEECGLFVRFHFVAVGAGLRAGSVRNRGDPLQLAFHVFRGRLGLLVGGFGWILAVKHGATSIGLGRR